MDYIRVLEDMLRACILDHKGRGLISLSRNLPTTIVTGKYTDGTV